MLTTALVHWLEQAVLLRVAREMIIALKVRFTKYVLFSTAVGLGHTRWVTVLRWWTTSDTYSYVVEQNGSKRIHSCGFYSPRAQIQQKQALGALILCLNVHVIVV